MNREDMIRDLHTEVESLIRLHQKGLFFSKGYQDRREQVKELIQEHKIDIKRDLDPISCLLYLRYID